MASLTKTYSPKKLLGQVYTPDFVVEKMLDDLGFVGKKCLQKTILDPACGDGQFLIAVAKRILFTSKKADLQQNLKKISGWDLDQTALAACRKRLDALVAGLEIVVDWRLEQRDALAADGVENFDFIVGNPPFVRIQHLEKVQRLFIQKHFSFCRSGSTDLFIAFFEQAMRLLAEKGRAAFIAPNTWLRTETGRRLRDHFFESRTLERLTDFGEIQLFEKATAYCAIAVFGNEPQPDFLFEKAVAPTDFLSRKIPFSELEAQPFWQLSTEKEPIFIGKRLKNCCQIHVGLCTLLDSAFFFDAKKISENHFLAQTKLRGEIKIEAAILRPLIKVSKMKRADEPIREWALFPYKKVNGRHVLLTENELKNDFPLAFSYLSSIKNELTKRDNGKPIGPAWFAFGRSQGLDTSFGRKILFSPMGKKPLFIVTENEEATFYSGYCIKWDGDLDWLAEQLNSERMQKFIAISARDFRGGWKAYNKKVVQEFAVAWPPPSEKCDEKATKKAALPAPKPAFSGQNLA